MPSAEIKFETKWWILNTPDDMFKALKEIRAELGWNGGVDVWDIPENQTTEVWQLKFAPKDLSVEAKTTSIGNVVMLVAGNIQVFDNEAAWREQYPNLAGV
jgi:hypothetical protein